MALITWGEFKRQLEDKGVTDDMLIGVIERSAWMDGVWRVDFEPRGIDRTMFWAK